MRVYAKGYCRVYAVFGMLERNIPARLIEWPFPVAWTLIQVGPIQCLSRPPTHRDSNNIKCHIAVVSNLHLHLSLCDKSFPTFPDPKTGINPGNVFHGKSKNIVPATVSANHCRAVVAMSSGSQITDWGLTARRWFAFRLEESDDLWSSFSQMSVMDGSRIVK